MFRKKKRKTKLPVAWEKAPDIEEQVTSLIEKLEIDWLTRENIHCVRSKNSTARAYARIWGMGRVWQETLGIPPSYCIEVISEKYDHLPEHKRSEILLHELAHIPKNFSGALVPHTKRGKGSFHDKLEGMIRAYKKAR
jgi:predicted metallopeptidase